MVNFRAAYLEARPHRRGGAHAARVKVYGAAQDDEDVAAGAALHRQQLALVVHAQPRGRQHLHGMHSTSVLAVLHKALQCLSIVCIPSRACHCSRTALGKALEQDIIRS